MLISVAPFTWNKNMTLTQMHFRLQPGFATRLQYAGTHFQLQHVHVNGGVHFFPSSTPYTASSHQCQLRWAVELLYLAVLKKQKRTSKHTTTAGGKDNKQMKRKNVDTVQNVICFSVMVFSINITHFTSTQRARLVAGKLLHSVLANSSPPPHSPRVLFARC